MQRILARVGEYCKKIDLLLFALAVVCTGCGLMLIYSATRRLSNGDHAVLVQLGALLLGILAFIVASLVDLDRIARYWQVLFALNLLFMASLLVWGVGGDTVGNNAWLRFFGIGVQPAEIGKVVFIVTFSRHAYELRDRLSSLWAVVQLAAHALITTGLMYFFSDDLGMAVIFMFIFLILLFSSGVALRWFGAVTLLIIGAIPILWTYLMANYQKMRILVIFEPELSPAIAYHGQQSMITLGAGKLFGSGYLQGRQTQYGQLPSQHTDFIFSVAGEEFGYVGCAVILLLLTFIVLRLFINSTKTNDLFSRLVCVGVGGMIMAQTMCNVGMCAGVMPVIGLTLPFFSYGGTSILTLFIALGIASGFLLRQKPLWLRQTGE